KWQDRRQILTQIVPKISNTEILDSIANLNNKQEIMDLTNQLNTGKTLDDYKKQIAVRRKKINDDLKNIPTRIDEVSRNTPEAFDFDGLRRDKKTLYQSLQSIDAQIEYRYKAFDAKIQERNAISGQAHAKSLELENIEREIRNR